MKSSRKIFGRITVAIIIVAVMGYAYYRYRYPFGWSHRCDIALHQALFEYAEEHNGRFPHGESSPEASLSLVYQMVPSIGSILGGKSISENVALDRLKAGRLLDPDSCGWHYVEGLSITDDPNLALFWDKIGLDHNGGRLPNGGHSVVTISGSRTIVSASEWNAFLEGQKAILIKKRAQPAVE
jgi:hypothetical protein